MVEVMKMGFLPHEKLTQRFDNACDSSISYREAEKALEDAYMDFDMDGTQANADRILNALTMVEVVKARVRYATVHESELTPASKFIGQVRHT